MKISYEIYKGVPYLVGADMTDTEKITVLITRGKALSVKFLGEEKKICRGRAEFYPKALGNDVYRITLFTEDGAHELIPIKCAFGVASLYHKDDLLAAVYATVLEEKKRTDELEALAERLKDAVFGKTIL